MEGEDILDSMLQKAEYAAESSAAPPGLDLEARRGRGAPSGLDLDLLAQMAIQQDAVAQMAIQQDAVGTGNLRKRGAKLKAAAVKEGSAAGAKQPRKRVKFSVQQTPQTPQTPHTPTTPLDQGGMLDPQQDTPPPPPTHPCSCKVSPFLTGC